MNQEINVILHHCCQKFSVSIDEVCSNSTKMEVVYCRKAFARIVKERFTVSNKTIGAFINKKYNSVYYMIHYDTIDTKFDRVLAEIKNELQ